MKRRAKVLRMLRVGTGPKYGQGWASWVYYDGFHYISGVFSGHPTHAEALAHALAEVGLADRSDTSETRPGSPDSKVADTETEGMYR